MKPVNVMLTLVIAAGSAMLSSCQKGIESQPLVATVSQDSTRDKVKDSTLFYSKDIYLWYSQIPATFNPQTYADPNAIMEAIRAYSIEPGFTGPVDRWSFAYKQQDWDNLSSGVVQDFGLNVFFRASDDLRVKLVERESPAGKAGIHRGWRITKINGSTDITTNNVDFISQNVFSSPSTTFTFLKPDGTSTDIKLTASTYNEHPVMLDSVYTTGTKKTGYLVFNSFLGDTTDIYNNFDRVFKGFAQQNVQDVIIDLRYNGGGYVSVQEKLADYLINALGNGNVMMNEQYNDKYTAYNTTTRYNKQGSLNLSRIFFIVSNNTASAAELVINNLKPYMDEKLVGPSKTYGKPVGFFPIPVGDWYIFPVSFRSTNKNGEGNYYNGLALNSQVSDGLDKDWGDATETCLASALKYINTGSFKVRADDSFTTDPQVDQSNFKISAPSFKGAVASPRRLLR